MTKLPHLPFDTERLLSVHETPEYQELMTRMGEASLPPCPNCGSMARLQCSGELYKMPDEFRVVCYGSEQEMADRAAYKLRGTPKDFECTSAGLMPTMEGAIEEWNKLLVKSAA